MEPVPDAAVPNIAPHPDAHSAEQLGIDDETRGEIAAVSPLQVGNDLPAGVRCKRSRSLDGGRALFHFEAEQALIGFEDLNVMARFLFDQRLHERRNPAALELAAGKAGTKECLRKLPRLLVDLHGCTSLTGLALTQALSLRERESHPESKMEFGRRIAASSFSLWEKVRMRVPLSARSILTGNLP